MIINFDENNNINNNKKLFEFILDKFGIENPISFEGSLNNDGLPIGICNILYKNKKFKSIKFTCNNNSELEGPGYIVSNKGNSINFMFYKDNYAKIDYPSGSSYNGEVSQLKKDGYGIYTTNEGSTFEGTFYNDKFNGEYKATFLDKTTSVVTFVDNQFNGKFEKKLDKNTTLTANYQNGTVISFKYGEILYKLACSSSPCFLKFSISSVVFIFSSTIDNFF